MSSATGSFSMPAAELEMARTILKNLQSEKYKDRNVLFLKPFDLAETPGYEDIVGEQLNLQLVSQRLESNHYPSLQAVLEETAKIFQNAVTYHGRKAQTKWIVKLAKGMLSALEKERKKAEKAQAKSIASASSAASVASASESAASSNDAAAAPTIKLKLGGSNNNNKKALPTSSNRPVQQAGKQLPTAALKAAAAAATAAEDSTAMMDDSAAATAKKDKKPKLKLKLSTAKKQETTTKPTVTKAKPTQPKLKLKLSLSKKSSSIDAAGAKSDAAASSSSPADSTSTAKPKISLKLGGATTGSKQDKSTTSKSAGSVGSGSRGKELPKGVVMGGSSPAVSASAAAAAPSPAASASAKSTASSSTATTAKSKAAATGTKKKKVKKAPSSATASLTGGAAAGASSSKLTVAQQRACNKILLGLKRRQKPIEKAMLLDARAVAGATGKGGSSKTSAANKQLDLAKMTNKVLHNSYASLADFCLDARKIFAQVLKHNTNVPIGPVAAGTGNSKSLAQHQQQAAAASSLRNVALSIFAAGEDLMAYYLRPTSPGTSSSTTAPPYPRLLYCWRRCMDDVLQTVYSLVNPSDGQPTVFYFLHPVSYYCGGQFPPDYLAKIAPNKPMDFGTVTGNLLEGRYQTVAEFCADCRLVVDNCLAYYKQEEQTREDGRLYVEQATRIGQVLQKELDTLTRYDKSAKGASDRAKALIAAASPSKKSSAGTTGATSIVKPPMSLLQTTLDDLRALKYTDKATKITEPAMTPFENTAAMAASPDVTEPISLSTIDSRVRTGTYYATPEDFEYEVTLLFRNCEVFYSKKGVGAAGGGAAAAAAGGEHFVAMAKYGARHFRRIFYAKMRTWEESMGAGAKAQSSAAAGKADSSSNKTKATSPPSGGGPPTKKMKVEGKAGPRISITLSTTSTAAAAAAAAARAKSPKTTGGTALQKKPTAGANINPNQPVPLHIAIARVKEAFPLRRAHKNLLRWEMDCARYFKELLRHPWLSAARPKFIFHVPVPVLFPELREAYSAKIRKPMDLTTVECTLLAGNRYTSPEDFLHDIALTFHNAIFFNKDGRDVGDPLSCAYYDASVHLLRYARWLSLEAFPADYIEDSDYVDEPGPDGLPPFPWRLTTGNRKVAQEEEKAIVLKEPIDKSLEGDRWTWHEAECEKLLKSLRHQSDLKHMSFFIQPNYPADYSGYISKPMDWEKVQRTLKKRQYDKFGDVIDDLRLIFSNALKYNARHRGTDTVSGIAFSSAETMSAKLETAIRKMMLTVSDRLERERIDHANAEREMEAAERAEEARIRAAWKKDPDSKDGAASSSQMPSSQTGVSQKIRLVRKQAPRRQASDFEIPFFDDEDESQHERSYVQVVKLQKSMFEKQRQELVKMRQAAATVSGSVHTRLLQRTIAQQWVQQEFQKIATAKAEAAAAAHKPADPAAAGTGRALDSSKTGDDISSSIANKGPIKLSLGSIKAKKKKGKKKPRVMLDLED